MPEKATLAVLGSEPEIYFYSSRHSTTGYIYTYGLMEEQKYAFTMQQQMIREVEAGRPEFLVYIGVPTSWLGRPDSPQEVAFFSWAQRYVQQEYELVGIVDILKDQSVYRWGSDAIGYRPRSQYTVRVFKRILA